LSTPEDRARRGRGVYERALPLFRQLEEQHPADPVLFASALSKHAALLQHMGDFAQAQELHDRAVEHTRSLNAPATLA
jgi:tetratricopeptide (TPR) repeat protein